MEQKLKKKLKQNVSDEQALNKINQLVDELVDSRNHAQESVDLLERAIKHDYNSIVITELNYEKPGPKIVYVNKGFCEMTGYSKDEIIGNTPRILQGPKTDRAVLDRLKERLEEGMSFFGQTVNYRKDGSEFINQWDIHPLTNDDGQITHWVSYQHDITERKRAERMIVDTSFDFDKLDEESKRTLIDVDSQGNIVMANKAFRDLIGYNKEELKRKKVWDLLPESFQDSLKRRFENSSEKEFDNQDYRLVAEHKTGAPLQLEVKTKLLRLQNQIIVRGEITNISLQKKIMRELKHRNNKLPQVFADQSDFKYCVSLREKNQMPVIDYLSESFADLTGFSTEHFEDGKGWDTLIHDDDSDKVRNHFSRVWSGKSHTETYRLKNSEGKYIKVMDYARPEFDKNKDEVQCIKGFVSVDKNNMVLS